MNSPIFALFLENKRDQTPCNRWSTEKVEGYKYCVLRCKLRSAFTTGLFGHGGKAKCPTKTKEGSYRNASY